MAIFSCIALLVHQSYLHYIFGRTDSDAMHFTLDEKYHWDYYHPEYSIVSFPFIIVVYFQEMATVISRWSPRWCSSSSISFRTGLSVSTSKVERIKFTVAWNSPCNNSKTRTKSWMTSYLLMLFSIGIILTSTGILPCFMISSDVLLAPLKDRDNVVHNDPCSLSRISDSVTNAQLIFSVTKRWDDALRVLDDLHRKCSWSEATALYLKGLCTYMKEVIFCRLGEPILNRQISCCDSYVSYVIHSLLFPFLTFGKR